MAVTQREAKINVVPKLTVSGEQLANLIDRLEDPHPGPRHTVGIDIRREPLHGTPLGGPFLNVWCSCGWKGDRVTIHTGERFDPYTDIPAEVLDEAARSWRFHVTLSNRVYRIDQRFRRDQRRGRHAREEEE